MDKKKLHSITCIITPHSCKLNDVPYAVKDVTKSFIVVSIGRISKTEIGRIRFVDMNPRRTVLRAYCHSHQIEKANKDIAEIALEYYADTHKVCEKAIQQIARS